MKFAKQLDDEAIPEWRGNYLDYKLAKKRLKAVRRAIRSVANSTRPRTTPGSSFRDVPALAFLERNRRTSLRDAARPGVQPSWTRSNSQAPHMVGGDNAADLTNRPSPLSERSRLKTSSNQRQGPHATVHRMVSYGSIIGSPPNSPALQLKRASTLELPGTAVNVGDSSTVDQVFDLSESSRSSSPTRPQTQPSEQIVQGSDEGHVHEPPPTQLAHRGNAYDIHPAIDVNPHGRPTLPPHSLTAFPHRTTSMPEGRLFVQRMFSKPGGKRTRTSRDNDDVALEAYQEFDFRQAEFFLFLDRELLKIDSFHRSKEEEATQRLGLLREQLHVMREFRLEEILAAEQKHKIAQASEHDAAGSAPLEHTMSAPQAHLSDAINGEAERSMAKQIFVRPFAKSVDLAADMLDKVRTGHVGKTSEAMGNLGTPTLTGHWQPDAGHRDYARKPVRDVPYRVAKRKMKIALAEFYRSLELLKSYAMLNRTAFRKINKKYDKTVNAQRKLQYMDQKINTAHFVTSDIVDKLMEQVEDLYARYFERGNRKIAISKLRAKSAKSGDYSGAVARTCALAGAGAVFAIQATVLGFRDLFHPSDIAHKTQTEYLLQLYAGYFLTLLLMALFCFDAGIFVKYKVNYPFIFELDNRHHLNWLELCELPAWLFFGFGVFMWLNFSHVGGDDMHLYWFVVLLALSVALLFAPVPIMYYRARRWMLYSLWRLLAAGLYPVEFRDFFLGDMFCSLTYPVGNIELFFCLYARNWNGEEMCNSSHSRLLGFLTTLPGIWRALQCLRRYWDTRNAFPHLANFAKYGCTILMYMSLSMYRINKIAHFKAFFIACATINAVYCSLWDVFMDWSLGDFKSKNFGLRPMLVYKNNQWFYYLAVILDPILRFNWVFYAVYTEDIQHSTAVAFFVALSEVVRRGLWTVFRVENEQCTNTINFRASRNMALPYRFSEPSSTDRLLEHDTQNLQASEVRGISLAPDPSPGIKSLDGTQTPQDRTNASNKPSTSSSPNSVESGQLSDGRQNDAAPKRQASRPEDRPESVSPAKHTSRPKAPQRTYTSRTAERDTAATPFGLLGIRFRNRGAAEAHVEPAAADPERGERLRPTTSHADSATSQRLHRTETSSSGGLVTSLKRIGDTMRSAHAQDYQKRKRPVESMRPDDSDDEDEDDSEDDED